MNKIVNKADPRRKCRYIFPNMAKSPSIRQALIEQFARKPPEDNNEKGKRLPFQMKNNFRFKHSTLSIPQGI